LVKLSILSPDFLLNKKAQYVLYSVSAVIAGVIVLFGYSLYSANMLPEFYMHVFVVMGLVAGMVLPSMVLIIEDRRRNEIDLMLPRLLDDISEGLQSGMTLIEAMEESSKRNYGFISKELKILVGQMSWGVPLEDAFENFSKRIGTDMAKKTTVLILSAIHLGGDLKSVFGSTSMFIRKMLDAKADRNDQLRPYLSIIYVTIGVFLVMMVMLYSSISTLFALQSPIVKIQMTKTQLKLILFDLSVMEALFGGLIATKLSSGSIYPGLKHSIIMLLLNVGVFMVLMV
jgi:flagellar protein FlaJ